MSKFWRETGPATTCRTLCLICFPAKTGCTLRDRNSPAEKCYDFQFSITTTTTTTTNLHPALFCNFSLARNRLQKKKDRVTESIETQERPTECSALGSRLRASSYEPGNRAGSLSGTNFVVCSDEKFQPGRPR